MYVHHAPAYTLPLAENEHSFQTLSIYFGFDRVGANTRNSFKQLLEGNIFRYAFQARAEFAESKQVLWACDTTKNEQSKFTCNELLAPHRHRQTSASPPPHPSRLFPGALHAVQRETHR